MNTRAMNPLKYNLTIAQLTGQDDSHLVEVAANHHLQAQAAEAFERLQQDACSAGFDLAIASSFRSFNRQLTIWNGKAAGERPVHDDKGQPLSLCDMSAEEKLWAILRFSALPGASRHHWGTDLDVFDTHALPESYQLQLSPSEVAPGSMFDPMHSWLDQRMRRNESHGFYRPYDRDRGGVAPERWHLSYAPLAVSCASMLSPQVIADVLAGYPLELGEDVHRCWPAIYSRFVEVPAQWCPSEYSP